MDTTETVTHVSLCAGYGGIDLGLKRAVPNLRTIAFSEIEAFACANLVAKMEAGLLDAAPIWTDLKTFPWDAFHGKVHILSGGYPCQPFSAAGLRKGADDPRHLWPFIADGIGRMGPELCFFENVEGHVSLGLREVIGELESLGYRTAWGLFSAAEVGAPHQRKRVFIMAHRDGQRGQLQDWWVKSGQQMPFGNGETRGNVWPSRPGQPQFAWEPPRVVANAKHDGHAAAEAGRSVCRGEQNKGRTEEQSGVEQSEGSGAVPCLSIVGNASDSGRSQPFQSKRAQTSQPRPLPADAVGSQAQPTLGGNADGAAGGLYYADLCVSCDNRTDELRLLGNGVVPQCAERAFRVLAGRLFQ